MELLYRINRLLMFAAMLVYVPLTLALAGGLGYGGYRLTMAVVNWLPTIRVRSTSYGIFLVAVLLVDLILGSAAFALLAGLVHLFARLRSEPEQGLLPLGAEHRHFFKLLERVCDKLKVRMPDECCLSPFGDTYVSDEILSGENGRGKRKVRRLVVGAGVLVHLRIDELTTILCHEMAHIKAGDTKFCWLALRFHHGLVSAIHEQSKSDEVEEELGLSVMNQVVAVGLMGYYYLFSLMYALDERWCELRADRWAAVCCGPQNVRNMLIKIHLTDYVPELSVAALLEEYSQDESDMSNLYGEHRRRWAELPTRRLHEAESEMFLARHSVYDSHPCLASRMRALKSVEAREVAGEKPATMLFANWNRLEASMTDTLVKRGRLLCRAYMAQLLTEGRG